MITVCIVSADKRLQGLCEDVLVDTADRTWRVVLAETGTRAPEGDVFLWDFDPVTHDCSGIEPANEIRSIFLVQRKDLPFFRERMPGAAVSVLLKPVNRVALRLLIEDAVGRQAEVQRTLGTANDIALRSDRDELLQRLFETNVRLQEYDQDRSNFIARTLHDFRAPLTAISGYCGLLLSQQVGPVVGEQFDILQRMQNSIGRLNRMTDAMFQLSVRTRVEARSHMRPADIESSLAQAVCEVMGVAKEKNISIRTTFQAPLVPLCFDPTKIEQALVNLMDNACKFTPKNGYVDVQAHPWFWRTDTSDSDQRAGSPNAYKIAISDSGPGIPASRLDRIFEEYTSYSGSSDRSGAGLGLAICKMIVDDHSGRIFAASSGRGVTFNVLLPSPSKARAGGGFYCDSGVSDR